MLAIILLPIKARSSLQDVSDPQLSRLNTRVNLDSPLIYFKSRGVLMEKVEVVVMVVVMDIVYHMMLTLK